MNRQPESAKDRLARTLFRTLQATMSSPPAEDHPLASIVRLKQWIEQGLSEPDQEIALALLPLLLDRLQLLLEQGGQDG